MSQAERPAYCPPLPELYPRTDYIPLPSPVAADVQPAALPPEPSPAGLPAVVEPREKQPYVKLTGRVAALPTVRTTGKTGRLVATFPLAVHEARDDEVVTTYQ